MKIDRENIDDFYQSVNTKIDRFFKNNVSAKQLKRYLKPGSKGLERFIKREELEDVKNIDKVISDIIEDRLAMEETGRTILTYESYINETYDIKFKLDDKYKPLIADLYKVSLGHIEGDNNYLKITRLKDDIELYVFTKEMIDEIFSEIIDKIYQDFSKRSYTFSELDINIPFHIFDEDTFKNIILEKNILSYQDIETVLSYITNDVYELKYTKEIIIFEKR